MDDILIKDIDHLRRLIKANKGGCLDFFIVQTGGHVNKFIGLSDEGDKEFWINNQINDTGQDLTEEELWTESIIGDALMEGRLYLRAFCYEDLKNG